MGTALSEKMACKKNENDASFDRSQIVDTRPSQGDVKIFGQPAPKIGGMPSVKDMGGTVAERKDWASGSMESQLEGPIQRTNVQEWIEKARDRNQQNEQVYQ